MNIKRLFLQESTRRQALVQGYVVPDTARCVQCGICSYSCPIGIDIRQHAWEGAPVKDSHCLTCGECVARCPRGVLRLERTKAVQLAVNSNRWRRDVRFPARRYVIIGTGAAGISAAETIRRHDPSGDILPISQEPFGYYSRPGLAYYLTGELAESQLYPFTEVDFLRLNIHLLHARVTRLRPAEHLVELHDGTLLPYDRLLIATGSTAARMPVAGADLEGVVKLDDMDDARRIHRLARRARAAVVIGGGITALEIVEGLRALGVKTHYFLRQERYWSNVLDETESSIIEQRLKEEGVNIHYHTELAEILGQRGRVVGVRTKDGRHIPCNLVAIAIGVRPRKELAEQAGLETDRGILVNEFMQTSDSDIFAAGDVAQVYDPFSRVHVLDTLWGPAREQGQVAGINMTGHPYAYHKPLASNVTRLAGLTTTIIGTVGRGEDTDLISISRGDSETWRQLPDVIAAQNNFEVNSLRVMVGERTLMGAVLMGNQTLSRSLQHLVAHQVDITPVRARLLRPNAPLADLIADLWIQWQANPARTHYATQHS